MKDSPKGRLDIDGARFCQSKKKKKKIKKIKQGLFSEGTYYGRELEDHLILLPGSERREPP
jgi:hypothetical protein